MFSNINKKYLLDIILLLSLSLSSCVLLSCAPKIGEEPPPDTLPELGSTKCFSRAADVLVDFAHGDAQDRDLNQTWDCVRVAFETFHKYVRGSDKDKYSSRELADFIERNFLERDAFGKVRKIPDGLVAEFMRFKQLFVGGSHEWITRQELLESIQFIDKDIRLLTLAVNPYMKIYVQKWAPHHPLMTQDDLSLFEKSNLVLQENAKKLASYIRKDQPAYQFINVANLFTELSHFYGENWSLVDVIKKYLPVVGKVKVAVSGGKDSEINSKEWPSFILLGARGYVQFLRYHYFIKTAPESDSALKLNYITRTVEDTFSIFQDLVNIKPSQVVTILETQEIVMSLSQVWPELKASERLVSEFMKVKQVFFGGSQYYWSSSDFNLARLKVSKLKAILEKFLPYYAVYTNDWDRLSIPEAESRKVFNNAEVNLNEALKELGSLFETSYSYDDFVSLIEEVDRLYPNSDELVLPERFSQNLTLSSIVSSIASLTDGARISSNANAVTSSSLSAVASSNANTVVFSSTNTNNKKSTSQYLKDYRNLFVDFKKIVYQDGQPVIRLEQWSSVLSYASRFYTSYLYYNYFLVPFNFEKSSVQSSLLIFSEKIIGFLEEIIKINRKNIGISYSELDDIILHAKQSEILPANIQVSTVKGVVRAIVENLFLNPELRLSNKIPKDFGQSTLSQIRSEIRVWLQPEIEVTKTFEALNRPSLAPDVFLSLIDNLKRQNNLNPDSELYIGLSDLYFAAQNSYPMTTDNEGRLFIYNKSVPTFNSKGIFWLNLSRTISRILIRGYSLDLNKINSREGITKCEGRRAFLDLRAPFIDLNFLDVSSNFINSRIVEANLFTPQGDGGQSVSSREFTDLVSMILSGVINDFKIKDRLKAECPIGTDKSVNKDYTTFGCMRKVYYKSIPQEMTGVPGYLSYMSSVSEDVWRSGFVQLLRAAGWKPIGTPNMDDERVFLNDISLLPHIIQYLEMVLVRFDKNRDQILSTYEVINAYPYFEPIVQDLAQDYIRKRFINERDLLAVFTYLVKYGEIPKISKIFRWNNWKERPDKWDVWSDRTMLANILGFIADQVEQSNSNNAGKPDECDRK